MRDVTGPLLPLLISLGDKHDMTTRPTPKAFRWVGVILLFACALIHLISAPDHLQEATSIGVLFLANAAGAFVMFMVSRLIGLPAYQEHLGMWMGDSFGDRLGIPSLFVEGPLVALSAIVLARHLKQKQATNE